MTVATIKSSNKSMWLASAAVLVIATLPIAANATPIYGTAADLTGTRDNGTGEAVGGLNGSGVWDTSFVQLDWNITDNLDGTFRYVYQWSGEGIETSNNDTSSNRDISHFTLDVTDDCVSEANQGECVREVDPDDTVAFGDFDGITGAVKFDFTGTETDDFLIQYAFTSSRAPVWGHLCLVDGGGTADCPNIGGNETVLWNTGLEGLQLFSENDFIARPNGATTVAAPSVLGLLGVGLLALFGVSRRR